MTYVSAEACIAFCSGAPVGRSEGPRSSGSAAGTGGVGAGTVLVTGPADHT
jgi:hypothetical protein